MNSKLTKIFVLIVGFALVWAAPAHAQQDLELEDDKYVYSREYVWGVSKNTNSGLIAGVAGKYSRKIGKERFQSFGLEIVNVKNPKEYRRPSPTTGNSYLSGKTNHLFSVRPQYGREWVVFKKAPQQGVQVNFILAGGPTFGIVTPYYVQHGDGGSIDIIPARELGEPPYTSGPVLGAGPFLRGFREGEVDIKLGGNIKASVAFEFGTFKNDVTGFEAGFQLEAFPQGVEIVRTAGEQQLFPSAFIMLFYGRRK